MVNLPSLPWLLRNEHAASRFFNSAAFEATPGEACKAGFQGANLVGSVECLVEAEFAGIHERD